MALHSQAHNSVWQRIRFTYVSVVKSNHDVVCRTKPTLASLVYLERGRLQAILGWLSRCQHLVPVIGCMTIQLRSG